VGALAALSGAALLLTAFLPWFAAQLPDGTDRISAVEASGELWVVPVIGTFSAVIGVALGLAPERAARRWLRGAGVALTALGLVGLFWIGRNLLDIPVGVVVARPSPDAAASVPDDIAPIDRRPAAFAALAAGALIVVSGLLALLRGGGR
jgi:protein-S-isoprenylcysteine O-methyltransferase Ste14